MQFITDVQQKVASFASENASSLLTAGGVVGTVATAVLTGRAGFKAAEIIHQAELDRVHAEGTTDSIADDTMGLSTAHKVRCVWPLFIPPIITGSATVTSIIFANRMSAQKVAALAAAYGLAERNLSEYKDKVTEKLTGPKKQAIDDELAQEAINGTSGGDKIVIIEGEVLCFDKPGGRYFTSTMEKIRSAVNSTNAEVFNHGFVLLDFFYEELELKPTTWSGEVGFNAENLLELTYTHGFAPGNRPCLVFDFVRLPKADYDPKHY